MRWCVFRGSYTLAAMFRDYLGEIYVVRKGEITFYNLDGEEIQKEKKHIEWDAEAAEKGGYEHFMMKEIHEQPKVVADTLNSVLKNDAIDLTEVGLTDADIEHISQIYIVACGSAYHVGMAAQYVMEDLARIPVRVELASEFRYRRPILDKNALAIIVSQSGETADSLAALREAKEHGVRTLGIVNVVGSSIAREADNVFLYPGRSGKLCSYDKSLQHPAYCSLHAGNSVCKGSWRNYRRAVRGIYQRTPDHPG